MHGVHLTPLGGENRRGVVPITDAITVPLPARQREPLLIIIDGLSLRRIWTTHLVTFAHYHSYAAATPLEAYIWCMQHPIVPQAFLLGQIEEQGQFFVQRLRQWCLQQQTGRHHKEPPLIALTHYLPDMTFIGTYEAIGSEYGCFELLEMLWATVPRCVR